jgi:hypothetical protein
LINCSRQRGLAEVYQDLLDFEGTEMYLQNFPSLIGLSFGELIQAFDDRCIVCGIHTRKSQVLFQLFTDSHASHSLQAHTFHVCHQ